MKTDSKVFFEQARLVECDQSNLLYCYSVGMEHSRIQSKAESTSLSTATTATGSVALKMELNRRLCTQVQLYGNVYFTRTAVRAAENKMPGPAHSKDRVDILKTVQSYDMW